MPAVDTKPDAAATLHQNALVVDLHCDVHLEVIRRRGRGETRVFAEHYLPRWREGGVNVVILNTIPKFGPDPYPYRTDPIRNYLLTLDAVHQEIAETSEELMLVLEPEDVLRAQAEGKVGLMLGLEGAEAVDTDLGLLRMYHRLGLRIMNLSWHHRNMAADGVAECSGSGLSNFGRELVQELNRLRIMIDLSHLAPRGVEDVLSLSSAPVIASHSNAKAICDHQRNLDDAQIRAIAAAGGMIGVVFLGRFVAPANPALEDVIRHLEHIANIAGIDRLGIGPDYVEGAEDLVIGARRVAGPNQPVNDLTIPFAAGLEHPGKLPDFTRALLARGHQEQTVRGILGENFLRFFRRVRQGG